MSLYLLSTLLFVKLIFEEYFDTQTGTVYYTDFLPQQLKFNFIPFYSYPAALSMIASGQVNVKPLVTHRFALEDSLKAFETAKDINSKSIKVMIKCVKGDMNVI